MSPHAEDVLAHAIHVTQQHTPSITKKKTYTPSLTTPIEFHQPMRLTAICEDDEEETTEVELEQVSVTTPVEETLIKPVTTTQTWSISRIFTMSSIPLPVLSWPSWLFLTTLMIIQTCVSVWGYAHGQPQYALYLPYHLLPSIILLRWWLDTASTPTSPALVATITLDMTRLSPYDSLFRAYAMGFTLIAGAVIMFQSTLGHMLLSAFISYVPNAYHDYYAMWVVTVSCIMAMGEEGIKYVVASRVLTVKGNTGNKLPIMFLTAGTLGCVTACSLFFTLSDMYMSTPTSQLMSYHFSLLAMLPVHCCTATFIGLSIAYRRLIPESWVSTTHVLLLPLALRLIITCMYFSYIMLFHNIHHIVMMMIQMSIMTIVVVQLPYLVYQRYCHTIKHVY